MTALFMVEAKGRGAQDAADMFAEVFWTNPQEALPVDAVRGDFWLVAGRLPYRVRQRTVGGKKFWAVERGEM